MYTTMCRIGSFSVNEDALNGSLSMRKFNASIHSQAIIDTREVRILTQHVMILFTGSTKCS